MRLGAENKITIQISKNSSTPLSTGSTSRDANWAPTNSTATILLVPPASVGLQPQALTNRLACIVHPAGLALAARPLGLRNLEPPIASSVRLGSGLLVDWQTGALLGSF